MLYNNRENSNHVRLLSWGVVYIIGSFDLRGELVYQHLLNQGMIIVINRERPVGEASSNYSDKPSILWLRSDFIRRLCNSTMIKYDDRWKFHQHLFHHKHSVPKQLLKKQFLFVDRCASARSKAGGHISTGIFTWSIQVQRWFRRSGTQLPLLYVRQSVVYGIYGYNPVSKYDPMMSCQLSANFKPIWRRPRSGRWSIRPAFPCKPCGTVNLHDINPTSWAFFVPTVRSLDVSHTGNFWGTSSVSSNYVLHYPSWERSALTVYCLEKPSSPGKVSDFVFIHGIWLSLRPQVHASWGYDAKCRAKVCIINPSACVWSMVRRHWHEVSYPLALDLEGEDHHSFSSYVTTSWRRYMLP